MEGDAFCNCQHCGHPIKFAIEQHNTAMPCPKCGVETLLRASSIHTQRASAGPVDETTRVRNHALVIEIIAHIAFWLGILIVVLGFIVPSQLAMGLGVGMIGSSIWIYLIAQIVHIRANTMK